MVPSIRDILQEITNGNQDCANTPTSLPSLDFQRFLLCSWLEEASDQGS
jgi:hypothetical protein